MAQEIGGQLTKFQIESFLEDAVGVIRWVGSTGTEVHR